MENEKCETSTIAWWKAGEKVGAVACEWCGLMVIAGGKNVGGCM